MTRTVKMAAAALAFEKPVVLVNGDSHYFRVDKPSLPRRKRGDEPMVENFTRVEGFGEPRHHWVEITVSATDPQVFMVKQRLVPENMIKR